MKKKNQNPTPASETVTMVTDLSELEQICGEELIVDVVLTGRGIRRFKGRRLKPAETREIKLLMNRALPKVKPSDKPDGEPEYDFEDPEFQARSETFRRQARSLAIWRAFPQFKALAEKEKVRMPDSTESIMEFIENRNIDDDILESLFMALQQRVIEQKAYVGFTSGSNSPKS